MSCCKHSVFGFGDGLVYGCELGPELQALGDVLEVAGGLGLYNDSTVVAAQALYDANIGGTQVGSVQQCSVIRLGLIDITGKVDMLNATHMPKGDFHVVDQDGPWAQFTLWLKGLPSWALPVAGAAAGGLVLASTTGGLLARRGRRGKRRGKR